MSDLNNLSIGQLKSKKTEIDKIIEYKERNVTPEQKKVLDSAAYKKDFKEIHDEMAKFLDGISLGKKTIEIPIHVYPCSFVGTFDVEGAAENIVNNCEEFYPSLEKAIKEACKTKEAKKYIQSIKEIKKKSKAFFKKYPGNEFYSEFENLVEFIESEVEW